MKRQIVSNLKFLAQISSLANSQQEVDKIVEDLKDSFMPYSRRGLGLSAVQIGILKQVAIINLPNNFYVLVNPIIKGKEEKITYKEGCLSLMGITVVTDRYNKLSIEHGLIGERKVLECTGLEAIVLQHEIDHMFGKTMLQRKHKAR